MLLADPGWHSDDQGVCTCNECDSEYPTYRLVNVGSLWHGNGVLKPKCSKSERRS